jgi:hypothetical protein
MPRSRDGGDRHGGQLNEVGTDSVGSGAFSYYGALAAPAIFALVVAVIGR